jgi:hypothetical protein
MAKTIRVVKLPVTITECDSFHSLVHLVKWITIMKEHCIPWTIPPVFPHFPNIISVQPR